MAPIPQGLLHLLVADTVRFGEPLFRVADAHPYLFHPSPEKEASLCGHRWRDGNLEMDAPAGQGIDEATAPLSLRTGDVPRYPAVVAPAVAVFPIKNSLVLLHREAGLESDTLERGGDRNRLVSSLARTRE